MFRRLFGKTPMYLVLILFALVSVGPFVWIVLSAFKPLAEIVALPPTFLPHTWTSDNFSKAWTLVPYARYLLNSLMVSAISTVSVVTVSCLAAYSLVILKTRLTGLVSVLVTIGIVMPAQVTYIPLFQMVRTFGLVDTYPGLILPYLSTAFGVYMMTSFLKMMPYSLVDAARIDGLSEFGIVTRIVIPIVRPGIITLVIFNFQQVWKDFFWPMLIINSTPMRTVPIGIASFTTVDSNNQGWILAAAAISIVPLFVMYMLFQKQFYEGTAFSGMKM
jgi:ABC-type glycerol-3-phosphate transport system permease component